MKRLTCTLAALLLLAAFALPVATGEKAPEEYEANLVFQTWTVEAKEVYEAFIEAFNEVYPNIEIKLEILSYDDYWQKLPIAMAGGAGPDIYIMTRPNFDAYARSGQVYDLSELVADSPGMQENLDSMLPQVVESYKYHGKLMGIPFTMESTGIVFNKTLLEAAGLPLPTEIEDTWTWDTLREYAQALTITEGDNTVQFGYHVPVNRMPTLEYLWAAGSTLFNEDGTESLFGGPEAIKAFAFLNTLMNEDKVSATIAFTQAQSASELFLSGKIAMMSAGSWTMGPYREITDFEWDVAEMPRDPDTGLRFASSNVLGLIMGPNTKSPVEVLKFFEFCTTPEMQRMWGEKGLYIPAVVEVQGTYFQNDQPANLLAFQRALAYAKPMAFSEFLPYQQLLSILYDGMTNMFNGVETPEQAATRMQQEMNDVIAENQ